MKIPVYQIKKALLMVGHSSFIQHGRRRIPAPEGYRVTVPISTKDGNIILEFKMLHSTWFLTDILEKK